jgi:hypothetical protein
MQELPRPAETIEDARSAEMIRVWFANEQLHVSLRLGMWNDAEDCQIDERDAWGIPVGRSNKTYRQWNDAALRMGLRFNKRVDQSRFFEELRQ